MPRLDETWMASTRVLASVGTVMLVMLLPVGAGHAIVDQAAQGREAPADRVLANILQRATPLRDGIGHTGESITTSSERARAYYNQGLAYLHSYVWIEAARSFNQALRFDRSVAMAYLGLSYALGELNESQGARQASRTASALAGKVSDRERFRIDLRVKQLDAAARPKDESAQAAYKKQLDSVSIEHADDVELLLLVGHAQEPTHEAHGMGAGHGAIRFYEQALAKAPDYFATHHYLTHAYENVNLKNSALKHAPAYARMAASVPHAHHMYGHALQRMGRVKEAIAEFRTADALDADYLRTENIPQEYDWHYRHNLDLLGATYVYSGQLRLAEPILRQTFRMQSIGRVTHELNRKVWPTFLLAHGRADEALAAVNLLIGDPAPLVQALGHVLRSRVMVALNLMAAAADEGNAGLRQMRALGSIGGILLPDFQLAQGEYLLRTGETREAQAMLRDAAAKLRHQTGPDGWIHTLFTLEALARLARDVNDWTLAAEMSEQMREHDAEYAGTHYALARVAERRGDQATARREYAETVRRWQEADTDVPDLIDARRRIAALDTREGPGL